MNSSEALPTKRQVALLLVGAPGSGKTTLALQFPKPYVFDCDGNLQGPTEFLRRTGRDPKYFFDSAFSRKSTIPGREVETVPPFQRYQHFDKCMSAAIASPEVETIILSSLTTFKDIVKDDILRQRSVNPSVGKAAANVTEANRGMTPLMQPEWDTYAFYFRNLITLMRASGKTFILEAHYELVQSEADKIFHECIAIQGQTRHVLSALFTDTWQTFVEQKGFGENATYERKIRTVATNATDLKGNKTSFDLPPVFPNDYAKYIAPLLGPGQPGGTTPVAGGTSSQLERVGTTLAG